MYCMSIIVIIKLRSGCSKLRSGCTHNSVPIAPKLRSYCACLLKLLTLLHRLYMVFDVIACVIYSI